MLISKYSGARMNDKKIAFIICSNDKVWFDECEKYIKHLQIPAGYELDIIEITDATCMAAGYNEGMKASDAKYKIYMHHDVFILRKDFLCRMLEVFINNTDIGLMGVIGTNKIVSSADYWDEWDEGQVYATSGLSTVALLSETKCVGNYTPAVAIDGMLLMTQYDVEWREDLFKKWDFYDISQSFEFQRYGYKVAVMLEDEISTFHDCGRSKLQNYDESRRIFCEEYAEFGFDAPNEEINNSSEYNELVAQFIANVNVLMKSNLEQAKLLVEKGFEIWPQENVIILLRNFFEIYMNEQQHQCQRCFISLGDEYTALKEKYIRYKFLLREVEHDIDESAVEILRKELQAEEVTMHALNCILLRCCYDTDKVREKLGFG